MNPARVPPQAIEAEQSVIGGLLLDNAAWDRIGDVVGEADFYRSDHREIFTHVATLIESGRPADVLTVAESLERSGKLADVGGQAYIGTLSINTPSAANIRRYAEIVRERSIMRGLAGFGSEIAERAHGLEDPRALAEEAEDRILAVLDGDISGEIVPMHRAVADAIDWLDAPQQGLSTGFEKLDEAWGGLQPGQFIIVAGRPSMGKTSLVMNIAEHVGRTRTVLVHSLETTARQLVVRMIRPHAERVGRDAAAMHLMDINLQIDDRTAITPAHIRARAKRLKRKHGLALIVIDYLQLIGGRGENRTQEVSSISRDLKAIAKDMQVPLIAVAQLSRGVESRIDHRPVLSDLRESGQIEQDADIIAFVYREEYYQPATPMKGLAEVLTRKNRDGATGTTYLRFDAHVTRFSDHQGEIPLPVATTPQPRRYTAGNPHASTVVDFKKSGGGDAS